VIIAHVNACRLIIWSRAIKTNMYKFEFFGHIIEDALIRRGWSVVKLNTSLEENIIITKIWTFDHYNEVINARSSYPNSILQPCLNKDKSFPIS
jgi:hypothetical protein